MILALVLGVLNFFFFLSIYLFFGCTGSSLPGFPGGSVVKNPAANAGDVGSIPGLGRCPGEGNSSPLSMDRGACWATVHGVAESDMTEHTRMCLGCCAQASHWVTSAAAEHRLWACWLQLLWLAGLVPPQLCDIPQHVGSNWWFPAFQGGFLTTRPPGKLVLGFKQITVTPQYTQGLGSRTTIPHQYQNQHLLKSLKCHSFANNMYTPSCIL